VTAKAAPLGSLEPERNRTLVTVAPDGELAVGIRESVDRAWVVIKDARPEEAGSAVTSCLPWPWMVVGAGCELPGEIASVLALHPVIPLWLGAEPSGLPAHRRGFSRFSTLVAAIRLALAGEVGGMRLAAGAGVELPGGGISGNAELQALIAAHPSGFDLPLETFRAATRTLVRRGLPLRPRRDPATGLVSLR